MIRNIQLLFLDFAGFVRRDFHLKAYLYTLLVAAISIAVIYGTEWGHTFELGLQPLPSTYLNHLLRYVGLYFLVAVPTLLMRHEYTLLRKPAFYLKALFFVGLLSCVDAFSWSSVIDFDDYTGAERRYLFKVMWRMRYLLLVLPLFVMMRLLVDRHVKGLYGLCAGNHHIKAYMSLYLIVVPLLVVASFTPDFLSYYPNYKPWIYGDVFGRPTWLNAAIFEVVYMTDFIMVEMFFRGALVIGMASVLGRSAVLPMIAVYAALHFGKPALEAMSAVFGGYFLGAMAYQTRHIWGGVAIHMGIALLIELLRFFEHYMLGVG
jgi:hypothetical protein